MAKRRPASLRKGTQTVHRAYGCNGVVGNGAARVACVACASLPVDSVERSGLALKREEGMGKVASNWRRIGFDVLWFYVGTVSKTAPEATEQRCTIICAEVRRVEADLADGRDGGLARGVVFS